MKTDVTPAAEIRSMLPQQLATLVASRLTAEELSQVVDACTSSLFVATLEEIDAERSPHLYLSQDDYTGAETLQIGDTSVSPVCSDEHVTQKQKKVEL